MFDATNLASPDDPHMVRVVITLVDKSHLKEEWTLSAKGKETSHIFDLKKKA